MAYVDWMIRGPKVVTCNCNWGCPCEFNAPPTFPICEGVEAMQIEEGHFGDVRLDGLRFAGTYHWPCPVHEGHGTVQGVIDKRATDEQRDALFKILDGEQQVATTPFNIYGSTIETEHDPVFADIEFTCDMEARTARVVVPDVARMDLSPIRNPVTGKPHRAQIHLPDGWEYRSAEMASADAVGTGKIQFDYDSRYGFLTYVAYGPHGIIDQR
ncbi:MAG: DUF1326 domain-containing protein [Candidatus Latescibacterota bacterium]